MLTLYPGLMTSWMLSMGLNGSLLWTLMWILAGAYIGAGQGEDCVSNQQRAAV